MDLQKYKEFIKKGGKEWLILLLSLLFAFFIWFTHSLSKDYSSYFHYYINVVTNIEGRTNESISSDKIIIRGRASGFYILNHRLKKDQYLDLKLSPESFEYANEDDIFQISSVLLEEELKRVLADDVDIESIVSRQLIFDFPKVLYKVVPVVAKLDIEFEQQYMLLGSPLLQPDSVVIYGEEKVLEKIDSVYTEAIYYRDLSKSVKGLSKLIPIKDIRYSEQNIFYNIDVERFVEQNIVIPLTSVNVPYTKQLLPVPSYITVVYRRPFKSKSVLKENDFSFVIDFNDFLESINSKLEIGRAHV